MSTLRLNKYLAFMLPCCLIALSGCSTFNELKDNIGSSVPTKHKVVLLQTAVINTPDGNTFTKNAGEFILVDDQPVIIESPGHIGVMILPPGKTATVSKLKLKPLNSWSGEKTELVANDILSKLLPKIIKIQSLLSQKKSQDAYNMARTLRVKYPRINYLKFIEATCLVVTGRLQQARDLLKQALNEYPNNIPAQDLLRSISSEGQ